jgi:hypothetical protein
MMACGRRTVGPPPGTLKIFDVTCDRQTRTGEDPTRSVA